MNENPYESPRSDDVIGQRRRPALPRFVYARAIRFGLAAGLCWSLAPVFLFTYGAGVPESLTVFAAGMAAGMLVSLAIARPMFRWSALAPPLFGVASLPISGFLFGVILTWLQFGAMSGGEVAFRFGPGVVEPIGVGVQYARFAIARPMLLFTSPAVIATAYALRAYLRRPPRPASDDFSGQGQA